MNSVFLRLALRWLANILALIVIVYINLIPIRPSFWVLALGALVIAILNGLLKPILVIFTLPAITLSMGLFMVFINGLIFYLAGLIYSPLKTQSYWLALLAGLVVGLVNYILTLLIDRFQQNG